MHLLRMHRVQVLQAAVIHRIFLCTIFSWKVCYRSSFPCKSVVNKVVGKQVEHIARRNDERWAANVLSWIPRNKKKKQRRKAHCRLQYSRVLAADWRRTAKNRTYWIYQRDTIIYQWIEKGYCYMYICTSIYLYIHLFEDHTEIFEV